MTEEAAVSVYEIVGSPLCVSSGDGERVHSRLASALNQGRSIMLSFRNVSALTSAFLNAAVGQLYGEFDAKSIRSLLKVEEIEPDYAARLEFVADAAKQYFRDPARCDGIARRVLEGDIDDG